MDQSNQAKKKILIAVITILLLVSILFVMTACSLFTDAVIGLFTDDPEKAETEQGKTEESAKTEEKTEDTEISTDPDPGDAEEKEPEIQVESDRVVITSSLTYDKAEKKDFTIQATHEGYTYYALMGMGLINDGANARVRELSKTSGASSVQVDGEYLNTFSAGYAYFYYCVQDAKAKVYYEPFRLNVVNSEAEPTDVKIDYDIDCPTVYVTFKCDCGGAHEVSFDSSVYDVSAGYSRAKITKAVDKSASHTAIVTCCDSKKNASVTKTSPDASAVSGKYLSETYSFMGHVADRYVEDDAEAADLCQYLAFEGADASLKVYVSTAIRDALKSNASAYLGRIQRDLVIPWSLKFGCEFLPSSCEVTFKVQEVNAGTKQSSEYVDGREYQKISVVSHYEIPAENARNKEDPLPIDDKSIKEVAVRNVEELIQAVQSGYRPIANGSVLTLYNKARDFCYTYITDTMTDIEKLHVFYDYLAGEVTYDYSALHLFSLIDSLDGCTLEQAKVKINTALADDSMGFSESMKTKIAEARDSAADVDALISALKTDYLQKLSAFSAEGVFNDELAVCEGISYAFVLLCRIEGIECRQITGYATNGGWVAHAWNKVRLDGVWYCVDATWGNVYLKNKKFVTHRFFMVDEASFADSHSEVIANYGAGVEKLALGNADYYATVVTSEGHSLYVRNYSDLKAMVKYYYDAGSNYLEFMPDPSYDVMAGASNLSSAIRDVTGSGCDVTYVDGDVYLVYYTLK